MTSQSLPGFGPNAEQVRIYLEQLRELDLDRAIEVWDAYTLADAEGYAAALEEAERLAEKQRPGPWWLARQAAAAVARERLGDPEVTGPTIQVLSNVAGALVVRDLLSRHDFRLLQMPWARSAAAPVDGAPVDGSPAEGIAAEAAAGEAATAGGHDRRRLLVPVAAGIAALLVVAIVAASFRSGPVQGVFGSPSAGTSLPGSSQVAVVDPSLTASAPGGPSPSGDATATPPKPTAPPNGGPTNPPPAQTPEPPAPTQNPPNPTPGPTPTPAAKCSVVSLLDISTTKAQGHWTRAGFTGKVIFAPDTPPNYKIVWQSLKIGAKVLCTANITVSNVPPPGA